MTAIMLTGFIVSVFGIVALIYKGITYISREQIIGIGTFEASADTRKSIPLSPIVDELSLDGGIVMVIIGRKKS
ncbi:DUF3185 domain-containing protein [candidate division KSB1 bacterium]|nr:DUF3185 domain-containing protein [candidate division KSB1 bacterium]